MIRNSSSSTLTSIRRLSTPDGIAFGGPKFYNGGLSIKVFRRRSGMMCLNFCIQFRMIDWSITRSTISMLGLKMSNRCS